MENKEEDKKEYGIKDIEEKVGRLMKDIEDLKKEVENDSEETKEVIRSISEDIDVSMGKIKILSSEIEATREKASKLLDSSLGDDDEE